ncbi:MAG: response regulator transcription factor [Ignavibacteriae bacterium]|nr:response regulator transcription factor [Ignavibacteriota bacterium]
MPATVLLIDDDTAYLELTTMMLKLEGHRVFTATEGRTGLALIENQHPDVVLLDWNLPEETGIDLIKTIKGTSTVRPYIIMVSARRELESKVEGMEAGADDYLTKPFDRKELLARLHVGLRTILLQRQLAEQARHKTVIEMAVSVAHEIANPLATAMLLHQRLTRHPGVRDIFEAAEDLELLGKQLQRIELLVRKAQSIENVVSIPYADNITMIDWHSGSGEKKD